MKTISTQSKNTTQNTKEYIINTARSFFSKHDYVNVSMSDIARELNITKAALYYHFTSKAEIYKKVLEDVFNDLNLVINKVQSKIMADQKLSHLIKNYLDFGIKEKNLIKAFMFKVSSHDYRLVNQIIELRKQVITLIEPTIKNVLVSNKKYKKFNSRLLTSLLTSMMDGLLLEYSFCNKKINSTKISNQITTILLQ